MTTTVSDAEAAVKTLLGTNWDSNNVTEPTWILSEDQKQARTDTQDLAIIYPEPDGNKVTQDGCFFDFINTEYLVSIDLRSNLSRARINALRTEAMRLIYAYRRSPGTGFHIIDAEDHGRDYSNRRTKQWRIVITVSLKMYSKAKSE